jgi:23S rRNA (uridine2552-2'-O)-methyltransferase
MRVNTRFKHFHDLGFPLVGATVSQLDPRHSDAGNTEQFSNTRLHCGSCSRLFRRPSPNTAVVNSPSRRNKSSSAKWFARQRGDPFLKRRDELQFRARSAFKLIEIQERYPFLPNVKERSKGAPLDPENIVIVDLGAAPGGWSQAAARLLGRDWEDVSFEGWGASASRPHDKGTVISVDLLPIEPIPGCHIIQGDFLDPATWRQIEAKIGGREKPEIDVLLSDMAPSATGINSTDTEGQLELNRAVLEFVQRCLRKGGTLLYVLILWADVGVSNPQIG